MFLIFQKGTQGPLVTTVRNIILYNLRTTFSALVFCPSRFPVGKNSTACWSSVVWNAPPWQRDSRRQSRAPGRPFNTKQQTVETETNNKNQKHCYFKKMLSWLGWLETLFIQNAKLKIHEFLGMSAVPPPRVLPAAEPVVPALRGPLLFRQVTILYVFLNQTRMAYNWISLETHSMTHQTWSVFYNWRAHSGKLMPSRMMLDIRYDLPLRKVWAVAPQKLSVHSSPEMDWYSDAQATGPPPAP